MNSQNENILQWNCNGCTSHYCELKSIILEKNPFTICLQETHFKPDDNFSLRGYSIFRKDVIFDHRAKGGVAIFLKDNIPCKEIHVQTHLQAVAIQINYLFKLTICNLYLPDGRWSQRELQNLISQLPSPFLLLGDFNSHNPLWGSNTIDPRGRIVEQCIEDSDLLILNTGEGSYLNSRSNCLSAIDLTLCTPNVAPRFKWIRLDDHLSTDHFPIAIECAGVPSNHTIPKRWLMEKADWSAYTERIHSFEIEDGDVEEMVSSLINAIKTAATLTVPRSRGVLNSKNVPWWNPDLATAISAKKTSLQQI